jgi:hypothetical protein
MIIENWKQIPGYEGYYEASDLGNIKSVQRLVKAKNGKNISFKSTILKQGLQNNGYKIIVLCKEGKTKTNLVHRLIAYAFLNLNKDQFVDHINNNKIDNCLSNLRICTKRENSSFDNREVVKTRKSRFVGVDWNANKWRASIKINGKKNHLGLFDNEEDASNCYQLKIKEITKSKIV